MIINNITKTVNKPKRTAFKNVTFATIYGAYPKTVARILNISEDEGAIVIETIKRMIPATFELMERQYNTVRRSHTLWHLSQRTIFICQGFHPR